MLGEMNDSERRGAELTRSRSKLRPLLIGICGALLLVAVTWRGNSSGVNGVNEARKSGRIESRAKSVGRQESCLDRLTAKTNDPSMSRMTISELTRQFPVSTRTIIAAVDRNGEVSTLPWNAANLRRVSAKRLVTGQHKFLDFPESKHRMMLYSDNTVVDLDTEKCVILGVYKHGLNGGLNPLVRDSLGPRITTMSDKGSSCSKDSYGRCRRDGQYCRDRMFSQGRNQWTQPSCPSGWTKDTSLNNNYGGSQPQYSCGCGTACTDSLECDNLGNRGKCGLVRDQCDLVSGLGGAITDSSTVIGNIQTAVDVGAALVSLVPGGGAVGIVSAFFGATGNIGLTGEGAYNAVIAKLTNLASDIQACINIQITQEILRQIQSDLIDVEDRLAPSHLDGSTPTDRIDHVWDVNTPLCTSIGADFETIQNNGYAYQILPLGLRAAELCLANYAGLVADKDAVGGSVSILVTRDYRRMLDKISSSISAVIDKFYAQYNTENECNFYNSDKTLLNGQVNYLRNDVLANVNKLKTAFNLCPTANVARGKTTAQSSTASNGNSARAVDGNQNTQYSAGSCTHTQNTNQPFWYVDLGGTYEVCKVKITNRADCCHTRLSNFDIFVADSVPSKFSPAQGSADTCAYNSGTFQGTKTFTCAANLSGRYVAIRLRGTNPLTLCEVQVFGRHLRGV